jgi:hypothetical protein
MQGEDMTKHIPPPTTDANLWVRVSDLSPIPISAAESHHFSIRLRHSRGSGFSSLPQSMQKRKQSKSYLLVFFFIGNKNRGL